MSLLQNAAPYPTPARAKQAAFALSALIATTAFAHTAEPIPQSDPSYIFSTVLGTGSYRLGDDNITVLRRRFRKTLREETAHQNGWRLLLPVSLGYASLDPDDPLQKLVPTDVRSVAFVPGLEYRIPVGDHLLVKPYAQFGGGYDFRNHNASALFVGGTRFLWSFVPAEKWQLQLGTSLQWAAAWPEGGADRSSFGLFEAGFEIRRDLPVSLGDRHISAGIYSRWRHFIREWDIAPGRGDALRIDNLYEVGLSFTFSQPLNLIIANPNRIAIGTVFGDDIRAITFGLSLPF